MLKVLWLIGRNIPLGHHAQYSEADMASHVAYGDSLNAHSQQKQVERYAAAIVSGLSQYEVAELVAREWDMLPPQLRMAVTNRVNTVKHSGNVTKGAAYLDKLLNGRLKRHEIVQTERVLRTGADGRLYRDSRAINKAAAGASRAFAIIARPANYHKMSPAEKQRVNKELAKVRREARR